MLDSTGDILREEGYGALTSRRVAERLGVKQRLVYCYFQSMDDLIAEIFRRLAARELQRRSPNSWRWQITPTLCERKRLISSKSLAECVWPR